jgi:opacity protein-like surface antigen
MRKFVISMCVFLCLPIITLAQNSDNVATRGTVFGGYSLLHNNNSLDSGLGSFGSGLGSTNFNGWDAQGTFNFVRHFGVTADFSGNSRVVDGVSFLGFSAGTQQHLYNFLFGPTATAYFGKTSVFGHALFGQQHASLSAGVSVPILGGISAPLDSSNAFAMAFGGGVDIGLSKHFAIRAAQLDYVRTNFNSTDAQTSGLYNKMNGHQNSFGCSGGVVWRF